ncbi:MAG: hypothetical protein ACOY90_11765 [Candidatus Zhuqueibacterota bacterium]
MDISLEKLIQLVTAEVVKELKKQGVQVVSADGRPVHGLSENALRTKSEQINMGAYKSPVLTENHIRKLHELTGEVIIPRGTVITPRAKELIKQKQLIVTIK